VYLKKLRLQNIKCFEDVTLEFPVRDGSYAGWNVILGENGRGKSTLLRSIALSTLPLIDAIVATEEHAGRFVRRGAGGEFQVTAGLVFHEAETELSRATPNKPYSRPLHFSPQGKLFPNLNERLVNPLFNTPFWEGTIPHVLCYGYGPFRRLEGPPSPVPSAFQFPRPLSRFVTLFTDEIGLAEATRGLIDLYVASIDPQHRSHRTAQQTLAAVSEVVNALLPGGVQLDSITSEMVRFKTAGGLDLTEKELSDGYRSFLALVFDLLRHLAVRFGSAFPAMIQREGNRIAVNTEAVVLIDEADAHLHPSWQRELGERLRQVFPKVQFVVTTHSPFVAQEATDGGLFVLRAGANGAVVVDQPVASVRGWTASQVLTSPLFGLESTRDPETESLIREQATLTARERAGSLTPAEKKRLGAVQRQLSATLSAPGETYPEMQRQQDMADYVDQTLNRLKGGKK
jgi:energy-coupling factor transporter ATP-binding protein EcfA2